MPPATTSRKSTPAGAQRWAAPRRAEVRESPRGQPHRGQRGDPGVLDEHVLARGCAALHPVDYHDIGACRDGQPNIVRDPGGAHLHVDGYPPGGGLPEFLDLDPEVVGAGPVRVPAGRALVDALGQGPHPGHPRADLLAEQHPAAAGPSNPPRERRQGDEAASETVARAATSDAARALFATWTEGAVRYRIAWAEGGHQRGVTWDTARAIAARAPEFVNDPTESTWELIVTRDLSSDSRDAGAVDLAIEPRGIVDPRFTWRRGDVPAASHPTLAAALARVAGVRDDDVVWDPFAG